VRSLRIGPLLVAVAVCVLFTLFGTALIGESLGNWYGASHKPWFLIPLWALGIVGAIYYVLFATVLYRIHVHVDDHNGRVVATGCEPISMSTLPARNGARPDLSEPV
jgi:tryptophan-rich sensory protein